MHKNGCPARNSPYADCDCAAMDMREHTEQLRLYNENAQLLANGRGNDKAAKSLLAIKELITKGEYSDERALRLILDGLQDAP